MLRRDGSGYDGPGATAFQRETLPPPGLPDPLEPVNRSIAGPSPTRDAVGLVPDAALDPATYSFPAGPVLTWNGIVDAVPGYRRLAASSSDFYDDARLVWGFAREATIDEPEIREE